MRRTPVNLVSLAVLGLCLAWLAAQAQDVYEEYGKRILEAQTRNNPDQGVVIAVVEALDLEETLDAAYRSYLNVTAEEMVETLSEISGRASELAENFRAFGASELMQNTELGVLAKLRILEDYDADPEKPEQQYADSLADLLNAIAQQSEALGELSEALAKLELEPEELGVALEIMSGIKQACGAIVGLKTVEQSDA